MTFSAGGKVLVAFTRTPGTSVMKSVYGTHLANGFNSLRVVLFSGGGGRVLVFEKI